MFVVCVCVFFVNACVCHHIFVNPLEQVDVDSKGRACLERKSFVEWHLQGARAAPTAATTSATSSVTTPTAASAATATETRSTQITMKKAPLPTLRPHVICLRTPAVAGAKNFGSVDASSGSAGGSCVEAWRQLLFELGANSDGDCTLPPLPAALQRNEGAASTQGPVTSTKTRKMTPR